MRERGFEAGLRGGVQCFKARRRSGDDRGRLARSSFHSLVSEKAGESYLPLRHFPDRPGPMMVARPSLVRPSDQWSSRSARGNVMSELGRASGEKFAIGPREQDDGGDAIPVVLWRLVAIIGAPVTGRGGVGRFKLS